MIAPNIVTEVCRLLAEGKHSQRAIARLTGICRGTVAAIASGEWAERRALRDAVDEGIPETSGSAERCPGCGGLVYMPCVLCQVRQKQGGGRQQSGGHVVNRFPRPTQRSCSDDGAVVELSLRPEHQARYEEVVASRRQQGEATLASTMVCS